MVFKLTDVTVLPSRVIFRTHVREKAAPKLLEFIGTEVLERIPQTRDSGGAERIRIAETWLAHGVNPRAAERVAREAVDIAEVGDRPSLMPTTTERDAVLNRLMSA